MRLRGEFRVDAGTAEKQHPLHPGLLRQGKRKPTRPGSARGLHPLDPATHVGVGAKHVGHQRTDEAQVAFRAKVAFGFLLIDQPLLGLLDRAEHRGRPIVGAIHADAKVDLVGAAVRSIELDQREQRIGSLGRETV